MESGQRALAYLRVSVVGDRAARGRLESPALQRAAIDGWADSRGILVVDEVRDLNRSGGTLTRPGLAHALERVRVGEADGIIVARSDRASRRALDGLGLIDELDQLGGWIAAADGTIDTTDRIRKMATTMHFAMAESELERYRDTSAEVHRRAIIDKGRHMGPAPYGYDRDDDMRLVVDPEEAAVVRSIFERRADGVGWLVIARDLDDHGVRQRNGRHVNPHMLRRMVRRRVYLGEAVHGEHVRTDAHEAIVDATLWAAANRAAPAVRSAPRERVHPDSLLRGLVRCAGCRYVLKRLPGRNGAPPRWRCRSIVSERTATHDCTAPAKLTATEGAAVEALVVAAVQRIAASAEVEPSDDDLTALERRHAEAEALLDDLSSLDVRRSLGAQRWTRLVDEARDAAQTTQRELATARARSRPAAGRVDLAAAWDGMTLPERQAALGSVVQAVMVTAGDGPAADRVHVLPVWDAVDLPRQGARDFAVRPWRPGID